MLEIKTEPKKKHVAPSISFKSKGVRESFPLLNNAKSDDSKFKKALQLVTRCHWKIISGDAQGRSQQQEKV